MRIDIKDFRVSTGEKIRFKKCAASLKPLYRSERHCKKLLAAEVVELDGLQHLLYEDCLSATSTKTEPWHVVPADDKYNARLIVSRVVIEALKDLRMSYPKMTRKRLIELQAIRKQLER